MNQDEKILLWSLYKQATIGEDREPPYWKSTVGDPSSERQ